jgi:8-oxo-dGTP pyrophosphatase MutT (NUDIX family)
VPLQPGSSHEAVSANIAELIRAGHEPKQAEAIAYREAGLSKDEEPVAKIVAAGIMYVTPAGSALWLRQAGGGGFDPEWVFPGGKLEAGESARDAAVREAGEELGGAPLGTPLLLHQDVTARGVDYSTFLQVVPTEFTPKLSDEHSAFAWAPLSAPPEPVHPGILAMLKKVGGWVDKALDEAIAGDAAPEGSEQIVLTVIDPDGQLAKMLSHIKDTAAIGHSFDVVVDPGDADHEKKFGIDGDGAFRIVEVKAGDRAAEDDASLAANAALPVGAKKAEAEDAWLPDLKAKIDAARAKVEKTRSAAVAGKGKYEDHEKAQQDLEKALRDYELEKMKRGADDCSPGRDAMAQDRTLDDDGRLHVQSSHITRACVSEYWGREIPAYKDNGLQPDVKYKLLRPAEELSKPETIASLNNIPLLDKHVPVSADDHQPDRVIGSTGTDAKWNDPFLDNSLVIWAKAAIEQVDRGEKADLSAGYRYQYLPEPGTFEGEAYDGRMTNIRFNHVAHVIAGRTPGAMVGDSAPEEDKDMELAQWDRIFGALDAVPSLTDLQEDLKHVEAQIVRVEQGKIKDNPLPGGKSLTQMRTELKELIRKKKASGAKDAMLPDDDKALGKIADAISGKDAAFSEPFVRDITAYINTLDLKGGSGNKQQIIDYVTNRKSFDAIALSDKFGCTVGNGKSIQDKMRQLRQTHGEGVGSINKPVDKGEQRARQLRQQTGPRR